MFDDILGKKEKKEIQEFDNTDCCPYCGSEDVGVSLLDYTGKGTAMFCAVCGATWLITS